jgi:hypothetical protein
MKKLCSSLSLTAASMRRCSATTAARPRSSAARRRRAPQRHPGRDDGQQPDPGICYDRRDYTSISSNPGQTCRILQRSDGRA